MNWFWINIPLMAVFFLAMTGIPLWLVFKHPDGRQVAPAQPGRAQPGRAQPDSLAVRYAAGRADTAPLRQIDVAAVSGDAELGRSQLAEARR